jgi:hypothetical protein
MKKLDENLSNKLTNDTYAPIICKLCNVSNALYTIDKKTNTGFLYHREFDSWYFVENYDFNGLHQTGSFIIQNKR